MAKPRTYTLRMGTKTKVIHATPHQAAKEAARFAARGTFVRSKSMHEQPEGAHGGQAVLMSCEPSLMSRSGRVKYTFARCDIKPAFKHQIRRRKKR